ncbi:MAG: SUMF1/EgtB/PvdO family nonheme iron enzyme [Planctomycetes bacterium]|nr:SUMF1/EgtB/PvdO family nonheme iron enzyme [Planctomycetota bacterium]
MKGSCMPQSRLTKSMTLCLFALALAAAAQADDAKPYVEKVPGTTAEFPMTPIPGGTFKIGSPDDEKDRKEDEGPQVEIQVEPFWMATHEITWDTYDEYLKQYNVEKEKPFHKLEGQELVDAVSIPTPQYEEGIDIVVRMGRSGGYPAVDMSHLGARMFCKWLTKKTGHFYRLPTEAEWEYACRAGTTTAYNFGDPDEEKLKENAVYIDNSEKEDGNGAYRKVGTKKPNAWGLYDMHGNVAEWCLDQYDPKHYAQFAGKGPVKAADFINWPKTEYPCVIRGGSWNDFPDLCRSATRFHSTVDLNARDPQVPMSVWWHTEGFWVGFRVVRPAVEPSPEEQNKYWEPADDYVKGLMLKQGDKQIRAIMK